MPFNKKYQYYILLEINNGVIIEHREVKYSENAKYINEISKSFYKKILNTATTIPVGVISLDDESSPTIHSLRNQILDIDHIGFLSSLIMYEFDRQDLAKDDIFIPSIYEYYDEDKLSYTEDRLNYPKSNFYRSYLALYHFLVSNEVSYISDFKLVEKILESFHEKYLGNRRIIFMPYYGYKDNTIEKENFVPEVMDYIYDIVKNKIIGLNTYFLSSINNIRENDLYENYGLGVYEGGFDGGYYWENDCNIWVTPSQDDLKKAWFEETHKWNQNYINSLKKITEEKNVRFFLKASHDYPLIDSNVSYNPL